jgi:DNA-binding NarL/FixJ family response regulator
MIGRRRRDDPLQRLSEREREVLALVAVGLTNEAIGRRLFITDRTVESHIAKVLQNSTSRTTAKVIAAYSPY